MQNLLSLITRCLRHGNWRIPLAVMAASCLLLMTEMAYRTEQASLNTLVTMGRARLQLTQAMQRVTDAESGKRGYMLVGRSDYLDPYNQASRDVRAAMTSMGKLDQQSGHASLAPLAARLDALFEERLAEMQVVMQLHESGNHDAALSMVRSGIGREIMERLRDEYNAQMETRNALVTQGLQDIHHLFLLSRFGIGTMTLLSLGMLVLFIRQGRQLSEAREAQRTALVAERNRLETEAEARTRDLRELTRHLQSAREDERARLARDLHDELGALLTTAKLDVAVIRPKVAQDLPDLLPRVTHLTAALNDGIALKRRIVEDLCPSSLRLLGLAASLEALLGDTRRASGIAITHDLAQVNLSPDDQLTAYRVVQEALTNAMKYAQASEIQVRLWPQDAHAVLQVQDNGAGFDPSAMKAGCHGIKGMRFRIEACGGSLELTSAPGQGTCLSARLPLMAAVAL